MAGTTFLNIDGKKVKGEATEHNYEDEIQLHSWSWGSTQSSTYHAGGKSATAANVHAHDLSVTKDVDKSTPELTKAVMTGKPFDKVVLSEIRRTGATNYAYYVLVLEKVIVSSQNLTGTGDMGIAEQLTLNFAKFSEHYTPADVDGNPEPSIPMAFDLQENQEMPPVDA